MGGVWWGIPFPAVSRHRNRRSSAGSWSAQRTLRAGSSLHELSVWGERFGLRFLSPPERCCGHRGRMGWTAEYRTRKRRLLKFRKMGKVARGKGDCWSGKAAFAVVVGSPAPTTGRPQGLAPRCVFGAPAVTMGKLRVSNGERLACYGGSSVAGTVRRPRQNGGRARMEVTRWMKEGCKSFPRLRLLSQSVSFQATCSVLSVSKIHLARPSGFWYSLAAWLWRCRFGSRCFSHFFHDYVSVALQTA